MAIRNDQFEFPGISVRQGGNGILSQINLVGIDAPTSNPTAGTFFIYVDKADNKLKCRGPSGTVTTLGLP